MHSGTKKTREDDNIAFIQLYPTTGNYPLIEIVYAWKILRNGLWWFSTSCPLLYTITGAGMATSSFKSPVVRGMPAHN
eukprot:scaffold10346_cov14-Tisochrysis_lutea.AAC.1